METQTQTQEHNQPWHAVMEHLLLMVRMLETGEGRPTNLLKFAEAQGALAKAYLAAIANEGRTSMRAEAAVKALDLRTAKSKLLAFLDRADSQQEE